MLKTNVRPSRDLRNNYREIADMLDQHDHVIITKNGVGEAVLINMDVYAMFEQYLHDQFIYERLQKTKAKMSNPDVKLRDANEVIARIKQKYKARGL